MRLKKPAVSFVSAARHLALTLGMLLLNCALPQHEPLSCALFYAALSNGFNPFLLSAEYLLSTVVSLSAAATLSGAITAAFLLLVFCIYSRIKRTPTWEKLFLPALAQIPFVFLFPHTGYPIFSFGIIPQKILLAAFCYVLAFLFEGALSALLHRALRCRLPAGTLTEISLLWLLVGMGAISSVGKIAFLFLALTVLLLSVILLQSAAAVPFAAVLSLPLCVESVSLVPLAEYAVFASVALLFLPYGKPVSALSVIAVYTAVQYFEGLYTMPVVQIVMTLLACVLPAIAVCCIPTPLTDKIRRVLLFYKENPLPRVALNRNRRAVGEQLYEVSALFREIECAFTDEGPKDNSVPLLRERLSSTLCAACAHRRNCMESDMPESIDKLIAVGLAKGRVNLIDLPAEVSSNCDNSAGMLFALNKLLAEYGRCAAELQAAREGRRLLAQQAHGVSVILRDIALEQSEEYVFSDEEHALSNALAQAGILSSEIFLYGEDTELTVNLTLDQKTDGKTLVSTASEALGIPLTLAEKIPVAADRACFVLKKKPSYDAAFGLASRTKDGETASGDTHSILKIDERRFMVALSDGMGSGEEARKVSDRTLSLLESFYKAKMPSDTVLSTVNSLIAFSNEETFSCLDVASVNLDTGNADIVKIGSPVGFLLSGEELKLLEGESLPIGMLEAVHPSTRRVTLKADDFLIFMSDGVTTAFGSSADLCAYLSGLHPINPQSLAEELLNNALTRYGGKAEDDMTVLTVKLTAA